jgi:signal transduction histidine kinase
MGVPSFAILWNRYYHHAMPTPHTSPKPHGLALTLGWRRLLVAFAASTLLGLILSPAFPSLSTARVIGREWVVGLAALVAFGLCEERPARLPQWLARWALQVLCVAIAIPLAVLALYLLPHDDPRPFWQVEARLSGFFMMTMTGLLFAPWIAVAALFRQRDFAARSQALAFDLERSELERKALDARLRLLQAQVEPHFLFNTLANVRELVVAGSVQASTVLDSLIAYLRAAVPRLHEPATTVGQELELVRAYLELMHMRMPDRLEFDVQADAAALALRFPPTTLLTLVENAVRHGIDPSEEGGRIVVRVQVQDGRCRCDVSDTGAGLRRDGGGLGTGLATLLERLQLVFGGDAQLRLVAVHPHGTRAELDFPAQASPA